MSSDKSKAPAAVEVTIVDDDVSTKANNFRSNFRGVNVDVKALNLAEKIYEPGLFWFLKKSQITNEDMEKVATQPSVYDEPEKKDQYQPRPDYENLHRFDISARWTWREEFKLVRKIDFYIMVWACIMFFALEIDRSNLSQANSDNFLTDLGMTTDDFNNGNTIFLTSFLFAELPSQLVSKRVGPDRWIPTQMVLWSIVAMMQFFLNGRTTFYITRCLLGLLQGGFIPDVILYLSYFYTGKELPVRAAFFWTACNFADIVAALLGYGILHLDGHGGKEGWRWLFLLEGLFTLVVGVLAYGLMPASPTGTKGWLRGKDGWFTEREETIITSRVLRDDPTKGGMHNRQGITPKLLWKSATDYHIWPLYLIGAMFQVPSSPPSTYMTLTLRNLGFNTFQTNLLVIPSSVLNSINLLLITYLSELLDSRGLVALLSQLWTLPNIIALATFGADTNPWVKYIITVLIVGYPYPHAIQVGWCSRNSNAVRTRTVSASIYNIMVQISNIIAAQIYRSDDAPLYKRGNKVLVAINVLTILIYVFAYLYYRVVNARREKKWNAMSEDERAHYIETTTDEGSKRLDFLFAF